MNNSSAPVAYSTTSNDIGIIAQEISTISDTITLTSGTGSSYYYNTGAGSGGFSSDTITISNGGSGYTIGAVGSSSTVTLNNINTTSFNWKIPEEFVDAFPNYDRIEKMCKEYPGLAIAFEKFKTVYNLVKDHYDTPEDQRPKP
jgi:ligand-binding sensor protein